MPMRAAIVVATVAASLVAAYAIATRIAVPERADGAQRESARAGSEAPVADGGVAARLQALEDAVRYEREARQLLEDELVAIYDALEGLERPQGAETGAGGAPEVRSRRVSRELAAVRRDGEAERRQALTDAGFSESRAEWILERESELRMQAMQVRYEAMRSNDEWNFGSYSSVQDSLRAEIGDAEYEMYLEAGNRPTSVAVTGVLQSSPALSAGLKAGDRITHYDGERVYSVYDLRRAQMDGEPGSNVVVNFVRDGTPMQVTLPRGPLGITGGRAR